MNTQDLPREEIARLAYQLWEERGCPIGSPELDWERAEKALQYDASSDAGSQEQGDSTGIEAVEGLDVSARNDSQDNEQGAGKRDDSNTRLDGAATKSPRRQSRSSAGRTSEGPRRSTQVR